MAFPVNKILLTKEQVSNNQGFVLLGMKDWYEYEDGQKKPQATGVKYTCLLKGMEYEKIEVKVPFDRGALHIEPEELEGAGGEIPVDFDGFEGKFYVNTNGSRAIADVSFKAKSIFADDSSVVEEWVAN